MRLLRTLTVATAAAALAATVLVVELPAHAATVTTCSGTSVTTMQGGQYIYQQNEWNSSATQCASVDNSTGAWTITQANFSLATNGAPATYPSSYKGCHWGTCTSGSGLPIQVSQLGSAVSSWSTTQVGSGAYDVAYDIWFDSNPAPTGQPNGTEIMIWINSRGGVQPFGSQTGTGNIAGHSWNVWQGNQTSWKIISYVLQGGATSVSNLDIKAIIDDAAARGSLNRNHYLIDAEVGFEIWQGGQGLATNSFSFSASQGNGGPPPTTAPPTTAPPTTRPPTTRPPTTTPPTTVPPTTTPPPAGGGCSATYAVQSDWGSGFVGGVTVRNSGSSAISGWRVTWTYGGNQQISNSWGATVAQSGSSVTASNASWNGALGAGASTSFGFQGTYSGSNAVPTLSCQVV